MPLVDEFEAVLKVQGFDVGREAIQNADRLVIRKGTDVGILDVFHTGTLLPGGKQNSIRTHVEQLVQDVKRKPDLLKELMVPAPVVPQQGAVAYSSELYSLDDARHGEVRTSLQGVGFNADGDQQNILTKAGVVVGLSVGRLFVEGPAGIDFDAARGLVLAVGAQLEDIVTTQFKERLPRLAGAWSPFLGSRAEGRIRERLGYECFEFIPAHDRRALVSSFIALDAEILFPDHAPVIMPVGRVFEGFVCKLLVRIGLVTGGSITNPDFNLGSVWDSAQAKAFKAQVNTHEAMLDGLKVRLREHRHVRLHSQACKYVQCSRVDAVRYVDRVLDDVVEYYKYFKPYFT